MGGQGRAAGTGQSTQDCWLHTFFSIKNFFPLKIALPGDCSEEGETVITRLWALQNHIPASENSTGARRAEGSPLFSQLPATSKSLTPREQSCSLRV